MSYSVKGTTITLTRGDTFQAKIEMVNEADNTTYTPADGDVIRFAMKRQYTAKDVLIEKVIPHDTLILQLDPEDTKYLSFGNYVYDIQLTKADGTVDTFITKSRLVLEEEVD